MSDYDYEIQDMLDELRDMIGLNNYEEELLDSFRDQIQRGKQLTLKQDDKLRDIYKRYC